jgi:O-antigen ligase
MTPLGYIILLAGLAGLLVSSKWLYRSFVFWTLFSASSAANFGEGENASALQIWMLFGALWLLRELIEGFTEFSFSLDRRIARPALWLIGFSLVASLSLIMPVYINGALQIASPQLGNLSETPLFLTSHNFTQLLYLIFGISIAICVSQKNLKDEVRHDTERTILLSGLFVALWGLLQFGCNLTGASYPDFIFNNSGSLSGKGFLETLNGVGRISSVTAEPSIFAQSLVTLLPLTFPSWLGRGSVISRQFDKYCAVLFVVLLILCTSSTAYLGLFLLGLLSILMLRRLGSLSIGKAIARAIVIGGLLVVAAVFALSTMPIVRDVMTSVFLTKSSAGSTLERLMTVEVAFGYFRKFPILGIGWGSATSHDLFVKLLSNVGIIGTFAFVGAVGSVIRGGWRALRPFSLPIDLSRLAWLLSLMVFVLTAVFSGFPLAFGNFWLILGMAMSVGGKPEMAQSQLPTYHRVEGSG